MKAALSLCVTVLAAVATAKDFVTFTIRSNNTATNGKRLATTNIRDPFGGVNLGIYANASARVVRYSQHGRELRDETGTGKDHVLGLIGYQPFFSLVNLNEKTDNPDPKFVEVHAAWTVGSTLVNADGAGGNQRLHFVASPTFQGQPGDWDVSYGVIASVDETHNIDLIPVWQKA